MLKCVWMYRVQSVSSTIMECTKLHVNYRFLQLSLVVVVVVLITGIHHNPPYFWWETEKYFINYIKNLSRIKLISKVYWWRIPETIQNIGQNVRISLGKGLK